MATSLNLDLVDLLRKPREALDIEIKAWLDLSDTSQRAKLAKAIIALANHGGGYLVIGFNEQEDGQFVPASGVPGDLSKLSQDAIQDAVQRYVDPPIQCRTQHELHPEIGQRFPIVLVPGGHRVPIKAKVGGPNSDLVKDRVYIRRPGPKSEEPQNAAEWDQLFERCIRARRDELIAGIRDLLAGEIPRGIPSEPAVSERLQAFIAKCQERWAQLTASLPPELTPRFPHGFYEAGFAIDAVANVPSLAEFRRLLSQSLRNHSGWPPFVIIDRDPYRPRSVDGAIETWMGPERDGSTEAPAHHDFWRITPDGLFYTRRGLNEDGRYKGIEPGTTFDITTPTWRIGEIVTEVYYVAMALGASEANLIGHFRWHGLSGRRLVSVGNHRLLSPVTRTAHQNDYEAEVTVPVSSIPSALPEVVLKILVPLYQLFDFFELPKRLVEEELKNMLHHTYPV
jgi:hypothetical protein